MKNKFTNYSKLDKKQKHQIINLIRKMYPCVDIRDIVNNVYMGVVKGKYLIGIAYKL